MAVVLRPRSAARGPAALFVLQPLDPVALVYGIEDPFGAPLPLDHDDVLGFDDGGIIGLIRIVDEARLAHEQLGEMLAQPSGVLRASLPVDFAVTYLAPLIAEFARRYPGITFDFDLTPRRVDLVSEPFDVAIRMGESENSQLIARPLARLSTCLYASPDYLERSGEPGEPDDLTRHECLGRWAVDSW